MAVTTLARRNNAQIRRGERGNFNQEIRPKYWLIPLIVSVAFLAILVVTYHAFWPDVSTWARAQQQIVQNQLARSLTAVRAGDMLAVWGLIGLCVTYGVLHAVGPGHGKILISGAAAASRRTAVRMGTIGFAASLMQAASAIVLIYGGMGLLSISSGWAIGTTERVLVPASYGAMSLIGLWLCWRGLRLVRAMLTTPASVHDGHFQAAHHHNNDHYQLHDHDNDGHNHHGHGPDCGCKHMPTASDAEHLDSWRDVAAMIVSIGIRPCSGALIVLVIAWHFGLYLVGALSAVAMAFGTGAVVAAVAVFATYLRQFTASAGQSGRHGLMVFAGLQIAAGLMVTGICIALLINSQQAPVATGIIR